MTLQKTISFYLEDIETPIGKAVNLSITGLVLLSSAVFVAQTYPLSDALRSSLEMFDKGILLIFVVC
jgi:voltage-gated potassium channel